VCDGRITIVLSRRELYREGRVNGGGGGVEKGREKGWSGWKVEVGRKRVERRLAEAKICFRRVVVYVEPP